MKKNILLVVVLLVILSSVVNAENLADLIVHLQPIGAGPDRTDIPIYEFDELNRPIIPVRYIVENKGGLGSGETDLYVIINGNREAVVSISSLEEFEILVEMLIPIDIDSLINQNKIIAGYNDISLIIDPDNKVAESDEINNKIDSRFYLQEEFIEGRIAFPNCIKDTDGGLNYYVKGEIIFEETGSKGVGDEEFGTRGAQDDCEMDPEVDSPWATILLESFCDNGRTLRKRYDCGLEGKVCIDGECIIPDYKLIKLNLIGDVRDAYNKKIKLEDVITEIIGPTDKDIVYFPIISVDGVKSTPLGKKGEPKEGQIVNGLFLKLYSYSSTKGKEEHEFIIKVKNSPFEESSTIEEPSIKPVTTSKDEELIPYEPIEIVSNQECGTCLIKNNVCVPFGTKVEGNYCGISKQFLAQKEIDSACENSYECKSNECSNSKCISTYSLLEKILEFLKGLFK